MINHDSTDPTIDLPASRAIPPIVADSLREAPGSRIGPYKLLRLIGEGGFGSVFLAEQEKPVARKVALKIIKLGMDTRQVVARFEQERQALAVMDHPNIARVLDAGATDTGRPYFVMDLVKGEPISEYCDKHRLGIPGRLKLFAQVCAAVQHAHTKGIIHRDIKPSNVLVSTLDGKPSTKVIDFGIAKATASKLTEKTVFTEHRQMIGTPEYMSPEQAEGSLDIDTRTDVYSLGVLLYELLTGSTPFTTKELRSAAFGELQRIIREVEPPKPSTRLNQSSDTIATVAARRDTEPRRLGTIVRGELDWIVMKSLEKDRGRRYETANGLAMDIRRYLSGEAVMAAPPSSAYQLSKFIRRHRFIVSAGSAVAASLLIGAMAFAWQADLARRQRDIAVRAQESEVAQRLLADEQRRSADAQRDKAEKVAEFMSDTLEGVGPSIAKGRDTAMLKEMMDGAAARIEKGELRSAPEAELQLRGTIGRTYREMAAFDEARTMLEPAVARARAAHAGDSEQTAIALSNMAELLKDSGELAGAEPLAQESFDMLRRLYPGDHADVARSMSLRGVLRYELGDLPGAEPLFRESLDMLKRLQTRDDPAAANTMNNLASLLQARGDFARAEPLFRESLDMLKRLQPGDDPTVAIGLSNLGRLLIARGDPAGAEPLYRESLEMKKRLYEGDHPEVALGLNNLATLLKSRGDPAGAEPIYREAVEMMRHLFPGDNPGVATCLGNLATVLQDLNDLSAAEQFSREGLEMQKRLFPGDHRAVAVSLNNLASLLQARGDLPAAEPYSREAVEMWRRLYPGDHPAVASGLNNRGTLLLALGDLAGADAACLESLEMRKRLLGEEHPDVLGSIINMGWVRVAQGNSTEARAMLAPIEEKVRGVFAGGNAWRLGRLLLNLGIARHRLARNSADFVEAEGNLLEAHPIFVKTRGDKHRETRDCTRALADFYDVWDKAEPGKGHDAARAEWRMRLDAMNAAAAAETSPDGKK